LHGMQEVSGSTPLSSTSFKVAFGWPFFIYQKRKGVFVYNETFETREATFKREQAIKRKKSRKYIEWLIRQR